MTAPSCTEDKTLALLLGGKGEPLESVLCKEEKIPGYQSRL